MFSTAAPKIDAAFGGQVGRPLSGDYNLINHGETPRALLCPPAFWRPLRTCVSSLGAGFRDPQAVDRS